MNLAVAFDCVQPQEASRLDANFCAMPDQGSNHDGGLMTARL